MEREYGDEGQAHKSKERDLKTQQNKFWLQSNVNDILEPMMLAVCQESPADKVSSFDFSNI